MQSPTLKAPSDLLIIALDFPSAALALDHVDRLQGRCRWFKVGLELYLSAGPRIVEELRKRGLNVFLDLKLHDIPNTVASAVRAVSSSGAALLTVHAAGGPAMLSAAAEASAATPGAPRLLAVTVLTSMDAAQLRETGVADTPANQVLRLAALARASGISGLVCSADEVSDLRSALGPEPLLVVPGIRLGGSSGHPSDDQRRTATPLAAIAAGASMLVVGRPITRAANPASAAESILSEMAGAASLQPGA